VDNNVDIALYRCSIIFWIHSLLLEEKHIITPARRWRHIGWRILQITFHSNSWYLRTCDKTPKSLDLIYIWNRNLGGGTIQFHQWIVIRVLVGSWCLSCFFFVQIYCCNLTSHLTMPHTKPLINSIDDIANLPGLKVTLDRDFGTGLEYLLYVIK